MVIGLWFCFVHRYERHFSLFNKETFTCPDRTVQIFPFSNQERVSHSSTQLAEMFDVVDRPCQLRLFLRCSTVYVTAVVAVKDWDTYWPASGVGATWLAFQLILGLFFYMPYLRNVLEDLMLCIAVNMRLYAQYLTLRPWKWTFK